MLPPSEYTGVLLFDERDYKKYPIKLSGEQKALLKAVSQLVAHVASSRSVSKHTQRLLSTLIVLLGLSGNTPTCVDQLYRFYRYWQMSSQGRLISNKGRFKRRSSSEKSSRIRLVGMDNLRNVMCYMDSVLVSLFYSSSTLDFLLDDYMDESLAPELQKQVAELKVMLRFVVNLMRGGEHIPATIMKQLCYVLNGLGCDMVMSRSQQDALQFFEFLAESLSLPLMTMKLDIIHSGRLNVNDDMRVIEERALLISVPEANERVEKTDKREGATVDEDAKSETVSLGETPTPDDRGEGATKDEGEGSIPANADVPSAPAASALGIIEPSPPPPKAASPPATSPAAPLPEEPPITLEECLNSYFNNSITVRRHLERRRTLDGSAGSLAAASASLVGTPGSLQGTPGSHSGTPGSIAVSAFPEDVSQYEKLGIVRTNDTLSFPEEDSEDNVASLENTRTNASTVDTSRSSSMELSTALSLSTMVGNDSLSERTATMGSISRFSDRMEASRTRSSTIATVLNNVIVSHPSRLTRRSSSVSNNEVSLPAWMFLQLLPYYTDPKVKLRFQNHEEIYRRISRSKTLESDAGGDTSFNFSSPFDRRFHDKRPLIPICLKKYRWDDDGHSHKISRKVVIPEYIRYPYFIAEDRSRPGFVDFKRSCDNVAPAGSFMMVLEGCVCHRGKSVNSGHYVSLVRKRPFSPDNEDLDPDGANWLLFNDMLDAPQKSREISFNEAMETEDPYLLFYKIVKLDDTADSVFSHAYLTSGDETSTIRPPRGSKDRFWVSDSDSSVPNSTILAARKGSVVSQISSLSLKSALLASSTAPTTTSSPPIVISEASQSTSTPATTTDDSSRINNHFRQHLGLGASRSSSRQPAKDANPESPAPPPAPPTPLDPGYIDITTRFYWYDTDPTNPAAGFRRAKDFDEPPSIYTPSDDANDGGLMEKINSRLLTLKRGSITGSTTTSSGSSGAISSAPSSSGRSKASIVSEEETDMPETETETIQETSEDRLRGNGNGDVHSSALTSTATSPALKPHRGGTAPPSIRNLLSPEHSKGSFGTLDGAPKKKGHSIRRFLKRITS